MALSVVPIILGHNYGGFLMNKTRNILFLCTGNSCRSQMAEGLSKHFIGHGFNFYSAGTKSSSVNSSAIAVMNEIGIDISEYRSKHVSELSNIQFDLVITLCGHAHENCPVFPSKCKIFHQGFEIGEMTCPTHYSSKSSSINFRRSLAYGVGVVLTSIRYALKKNLTK